MKIRLIKLIDRLAGSVVTAALPAARPRPVPVPRQVLFIRPGGIGDAVLLVPALRALKAAIPGCSIDVLAEKRNAAAFKLASGIRAVHCYDCALGIAAVLRGSYDVVIDTEQWYRLSAVIASLTRAATLIGFATNDRARLFTHPVCYAQDRYEPYSFFDLLEPLGIAVPLQIALPFLELPPAAVAEADRLLTPLSGRPFVTVFAGASTQQKQWGLDNFRELVSLLAVRGIAVVVVGGEDSRRVSRELATVGRVLDLAGRSSLAGSAALIGKGSALVSGDSGLLHIAAGLGTPTVSLFGPSDVKKWGPQGELHVVLAAGLPCAPCSRFGTTPPCPRDGICLKEVAVAKVVQACEALLVTKAHR